MRPHVGMEKLAQRVLAFERDFALANPLEDAVAPKPVRDESLILLRELQRQIELALFEDILAGVVNAQHILGFHHDAVEIRYRFGGGVHQQRRQFVHSAAGYFDVAIVLHDNPTLVQEADPEAYPTVIDENCATMFQSCSMGRTSV